MDMLGDATPPVFSRIRSQYSRGAKLMGRIIFLELWERNSVLVLVLQSAVDYCLTLQVLPVGADISPPRSCLAQPWQYLGSGLTFFRASSGSTTSVNPIRAAAVNVWPV